MHRSILLFPAFLAIVISSGRAQAHTHGVLEAFQAEKTPVVDGRLDEWKYFTEHLDASKPSWYRGASRWTGKPPAKGDPEAWFSACWSQDVLFLAVLVLDDVIVRNTDSDVIMAGGRADCVDWHIDFNHDAPYYVESRAPAYRSDDVRMRMIPFEKEKGTKGGFFLVAQGGSLIGYRTFIRHTKFSSRPVTVNGRTGYAAEASLDLEKLGLPGLTRPGFLMGLEVSVNDADSSAGNDRVLHWSSAGGRAARDPSSFGDLLFTDPKGSFPISSNQVSPDSAGYYLLPGGADRVPFLKAVGGPDPGRSGCVVWSPKRIRDGHNISGFFDPDPYRPLNKPAIRYSQIGYLPNGRKTAFLETPVGQAPEAEDFQLLLLGREALTKKLVKWGTIWNRDYYLLDFQDYKGLGRGYALRVGKLSTETFPIAPDIYEPVVSSTLRGFLRAQTCGKAVPPFHERCHRMDAYPASSDTMADRQPVLQFSPAYGLEERIDVSGGFHDDGRSNKNMSRFPVALDFMLLVAEEFNPKEDLDKDMTPDVIEWIQEGLQWGLKMQDKDGGVFERVVEAQGKRCLDTDKWPDVTARWVASAAIGAKLLERRNPRLSAKLEQSALRGWAYASRHQDLPARPCLTGCYPEHPASLFWAAVEMYRLTLEPSYLEAALKRLSSVIEGELEPMSWRGSQILALLRFYPLLPEKSAKANIRKALANHLTRLKDVSSSNPFGIRYVASSEEGNSATLLATAIELYFLHRIFPKMDAASLIEPYRQWVYGANPSGYSFVVGVGDRSPKNQVTLLNRAIPGSVVPGIVDDGEGFPHYLDFNTYRQANEAALDAATANLFLSKVKAPYRGMVKRQTVLAEDNAVLRATEKPPRPPEGAVLDFHTLSADAFWCNGAGDWLAKNAMKETEDGRVFRCEFKTGEWTVIGITLEGDWTASKGIRITLRGGSAALKMSVVDADGEDWGVDLTASPKWRPVQVNFSSLTKPPWRERSGNQVRDFGGTKQLKFQVLGPAKGWFEIAEVVLVR